MATTDCESNFVEVDLMNSDSFENQVEDLHRLSPSKKLLQLQKNEELAQHHTDTCSEVEANPVECSYRYLSANKPITHDSSLKPDHIDHEIDDEILTDLNSSKEKYQDSDQISCLSVTELTESECHVSNSQAQPCLDLTGLHDDLLVGESVDLVVTCRCESTRTFNNEDLVMKNKQLMCQLKELSSSEQSLRTEHQALSEELAKIKLHQNSYIKENCKCADQEDVTPFKEQIVQLEEKVKQHQIQWKAAHEKWVIQDAVIQNTISQLTKSRDDSRRDKENMVMKYALAEQKNIELAEKVRKLEVSIAEVLAEKDNLMSYLNAMRHDKQKIKEVHDKKASEVISVKMELEKQKELVLAQEQKTKWYQNQLTVETDSHQELRNRLSDLEVKLKEVQEENDKMRFDKQAAIKTCQESLVMNSINSEIVLKETQNALDTHKQEHSDRQEIYLRVKQELDNLKLKKKELIEELNTYKDKVKCLNDERLLQEQNLSVLVEALKKKKAINLLLEEKVADLKYVEEQFPRVTIQLNELQERNAEILADLTASKEREANHLSYIASLSDQVTKLQLENTELSGQVCVLVKGKDDLMGRCALMNEESTVTTRQLEEFRHLALAEIEDLKQRLKDAWELASERLKCLEDKDDELKTLKRRHASSTKELTRRLGQLQRQVEQAHSNKSDVQCTDYNGGHNSSSGSTSQVSAASTAPALRKDSYEGSSSGDSCPERANDKQFGDGASISSDVENGSIESKINSQRLIAKVVQLQTTNIKLTNKLEFLQDHSKQLTEELRTKSRIIQDYVLREETYGLRPAVSSEQKATGVTKKSLLAGVLPSGSVGSWNLVDGSNSSNTKQLLTGGDRLVNQQLQMVVEDALFKNIQYKENAERMAEEVTRLTNQNKQLRLLLETAQPKQNSICPP